MTRVLHISPDFNYSCGRSKHVYTLLASEELKKEFKFYIITNGGDAIFKLDKAGVNYNIESFETDKIFHFDLFKDLKWLRKFCTEKNIDIIHSHHRYPEYLSNVIKKSFGIKTIVTVHNFAKGLSLLSYKADCIIAINNSVKDHLLKNFRVDAERIEVLYNCIRKEEISVINKKEIKKSLDIPLDSSVILYLGRIIKEKGIDLLVNAFELLSERTDNISLVIVGSGDLSFNNFQSNKSNKIKIHPPTDQVQKYYSVADIVVLPSLKEPFGYTMLEAGLNNIPFIGSRTGGIAEFIEDRVDGYLFESGNSNDLTEKIKFVLDHPEAAQNSALKLNEKVVRLCNCTDYFQKLTDIYHHLLAYT